ncbi:hypothetical protein RJ639_013614 [Escallonia herrerae]|uniref:Polyprotein n=1 Tax=Escallonia herrerae TaxID=1293975 RepID=A0AA89AML3_9ASTE|nr:hypothetical protein RJ639_013614 [Escallonia herrerae]
MADNKVQVGEVVPVLSKIAENKLNGTNYLDWSKTVRIYIRSIDKDDHLSSDPPTDDTKRLWLREDARLILQIRNSIDSEIVGLINHCEFVKELMDYLEFLYSGKGNISRIYDVCRAFYRPEKETKTLTAFFMDFKKTYEELNMLLPFSKDIKVQQAQREQMAVMSFLGALPPEFDTAKSQILSGTDITSLQEVFSRVLRTESTSSNQQSSILVANIGRGSEAGRMNNNRGDRGSGDRGGHNGGTSEIVCYYCKERGHTKRYCKKLQNRNQRAQTTTATVAATSSSSPGKTVTISVDEYAKLSQHQESVAASAESGKKCLISSNKWVIDSGATDHMTGNPKIFSSFRSHTAPSPVTIADGSNYTIKGSGTVKPTSSITLSFVLSLSSLAFNLMSVNRLTKDLNCCISFFPDHCLFQDLMTKETIGKGHVSDGLYILDAWVPRSVALNCESCHFAKHHRSSLSPRVNKRVESAFELVHSDVWGPCPVLSKSGFRYFVTFVDDFSRMTWIYFMKNRSEVFAHFSAFCAEIKTQFNVHVHILRSDNAKEYMSGSFQNYMNQHGILHQSSCTDTPAQNGVAERKNRHLLETPRALLFQMKVPKPFWADAISTACFLINRMPSTVLNGNVPYSVLFPTKPPFPVEPRIFGSTCFVRDVRPNLTKLDPKALKCVFLGYSRLQKGYRCYSLDLHKYLVSTDVVLILCYLKGAPGLGLLYSNHGHSYIECFSDADWAGSKLDRKSTTGYCVFVGGNLVSWKSKKQSVISRSSAESEYRAMAQSTCEVMWICHLLEEISLKPPLPAKLWCDNQAARHIASNHVYHERTKHIEVDCHFIREKIQENLISTSYVKTGEQLGDILTKSLNRTRVEYLCNKLGMINIYAPA